MSQSTYNNPNNHKQADWELDFYSRPIVDPSGKKRWELLITSTEDLSGEVPFRWEKICPADQVNSIWLSSALETAIQVAQEQGWDKPRRLRCWRTSMKTMITKAATKVDIEVVASRRTYSLVDWLSQREKEFYPTQEGFMAGPLAPSPARILNQAIPLPEAVRGDGWSFASLPIGVLKDAKDWPIDFNGLLPIRSQVNENILIPGLRIFSKDRSLALAGWLGGLEPVKLVIEGKQLILESGQEDRWLVTDINNETSVTAQKAFLESREKADGLQFIAVQTSQEVQKFAGFWMLRDIISL